MTGVPTSVQVLLALNKNSVCLLGHFHVPAVELSCGIRSNRCHCCCTPTLHTPTAATHTHLQPHPHTPTVHTPTAPPPQPHSPPHRSHPHSLTPPQSPHPLSPHTPTASHPLSPHSPHTFIPPHPVFLVSRCSPQGKPMDPR